VAEIRVITPDSDEWPRGLHDLGVAMPEQLWAVGKPIDNDAPTFAVVGARASTSYGEYATGDLVAGLGVGVHIVSGAAYGIDGVAHRIALSQGGTTIAYLAGGVDRPYPAGHRDLLGRIAENGTVLSEVEPGGTPTKWRFLQRNRLIAAHAQGMVVVEAGWRSGSLNAAGHALGLGRPLGAVPGPITSVASAGCHRLITEGATLITSADDIRGMMRPNLGQNGEQS
jgi:DNA processing protein